MREEGAMTEPGARSFVIHERCTTMTLFTGLSAFPLTRRMTRGGLIPSFWSGSSSALSPRGRTRSGFWAASVAMPIWNHRSASERCGRRWTASPDEDPSSSEWAP